MSLPICWPFAQQTAADNYSWVGCFYWWSGDGDKALTSIFERLHQIAFISVQKTIEDRRYMADILVINYITSLNFFFLSLFLWFILSNASSLRLVSAILFTFFSFANLISYKRKEHISQVIHLMSLLNTMVRAAVDHLLVRPLIAAFIGRKETKRIKQLKLRSYETVPV